MFYSWLRGARYLQKPDEATAQVHWLIRALLENEESAREWQEIGRPLPAVSEIPLRPGCRAHVQRWRQDVCSSNYVWINPNVLAGAAQSAEFRRRVRCTLGPSLRGMRPARREIASAKLRRLAERRPPTPERTSASIERGVRSAARISRRRRRRSR